MITFTLSGKNAQGTEMNFRTTLRGTVILQSGGTLSRADWRRDNVNQLVRAIADLVHQENPG
jgi:uncharacterized lipoprotein YddW (UPF0748 family)